MPATAADIAAATREQVLDTQESATIKARHIGWRDTGDTPRVAYWDDPADAAAMNAEGFALFGVERRRFALPIDGLLSFSGTLDTSQKTPTVTLVDAEHDANGAFLTARIEIDLDAEMTSLETFGS